MYFIICYQYIRRFVLKSLQKKKHIAVRYLLQLMYTFENLLS